MQRRCISLNNKLIKSFCPICGYSIALPFFDGGKHALTTLGWPKSKDEAIDMQKLSIDFVQCTQCTHIYNRSFAYDDIPYKNNPNRMFNIGALWSQHLGRTTELLIEKLPDMPILIDIGCGEGHFVRGVAKHLGNKGRFVGFDPSASEESGKGVEFYPKYFEPLVHCKEFKPDVIIIRHVLEHLTDPAVLMEQLAWAASFLQKDCLLFTEMPCVDNMVESGRLVDMYYEHPSQFTTKSFTTLMQKAGEILLLDYGYEKEVIFAIVKLGINNTMQQNAVNSLDFFNKSKIAQRNIKKQLESFISNDKQIAIWGGVGKAASFMQIYGLDCDRFNLVVDSDIDKIGTFVPEMGQEIKHKSVLLKEKIDILIIPAQWRAKDIIIEMQNDNIKIDTILIEHNGELIVFN